LMSYSCFQAKFVDIKGIFFYTHSPYFCKNQALYIPYNKVSFCKISSSRGGVNPKSPPLRTPLMTHKLRGVRADEYAYYVNKLR